MPAASRLAAPPSSARRTLPAAVIEATAAVNPVVAPDQRSGDERYVTLGE